MAGTETVPYSESTPEDWASQVDTWPWHDTKAPDGEVTGWWKSGPCPRCLHPTLIEIGLVVTAAVDTSGAVYGRCECSVVHQAGQKGCGASSMLAGPSGGEPPHGAPDPTLRTWQDRLEAARGTEAPDLRAAADKWAGYLAVLIGAVGSISVLVVPKALTDFNQAGSRVAVFVLVLVAGLAGLGALLAAMSVAQRRPVIDGTMDALHYRDETLSEVTTGVRRLGQSRALTAVALGCVLVASLVSQLDTLTAPASAVDVLVVHRGGTVSCLDAAKAAVERDAVQISVVSHC